jgi:hypothetical protein
MGKPADEEIAAKHSARQLLERGAGQAEPGKGDSLGDVSQRANHNIMERPARDVKVGPAPGGPNDIEAFRRGNNLVRKCSKPTMQGIEFD